MKKLFLLSAVLTLGALSSFAQGSVSGNNNGTGIAIMIQSPTINGGTAVKIGNPAVAAGFTGAGPGQVAVELFAAPDSVAHGSFAAIEAGTVLFNGFNVSSGLAGQQGNVAPGSGIVLPTQAGFDGSALVDFLFVASVTVNGTLFTSTTTGEAAVTPTSAASVATGTLPIDIWGGSGIQSLVLTSVPEPTTLALGGLGAAALLYFRRRK